MSWYDIRNKADKAEIWLYDQIGEDVWGEGTTAKSFIEELNGIKAKQIDVHLNSPGGSVFDGQAMYSNLKRHPAHVTSYIDGVAASIAGVVALAADEVVMAKNAMFMVHDPWGMAMGSAKDIRAYADVLDKVRQTIVGVYSDKTGMDAEAIQALMEAETWMTAADAIDMGFADEMAPELALAACSDFSAFNYKHPPVAAATVDEPDDGEPVANAECDREPEAPSDLDWLGLPLGVSPDKQ